MTASWTIPSGFEVAMVHGYPLAYRTTGAGRALILIHGSFNDARTWDAHLDAFAPHCRVIAPSLRHYWPEPWSRADDDFSIGQHAADIAHLIGELRVEGACVLGHSRGGAVALTLARRRPELLGALILADPRGLEGLLPSSDEGSRNAGELRALFTDLERNLRDGDLDHAARCFVDALAGSGAWDRRAPDVKQMFFDNVATAVDTGEAPPMSCDDVHALRLPVLLLTGARSPGRYHEMLARFQECSAQDAAQVVVPDAGHAMHRDNPEAFQAAVLAFVRRLPPA